MTYEELTKRNSFISAVTIKSLCRACSEIAMAGHSFRTDIPDPVGTRRLIDDLRKVIRQAKGSLKSLDAELGNMVRALKEMYEEQANAEN